MTAPASGRSFDTVVVGAGLAGLAAALRIAEAGRRVALVARGIGATHVSPPTIDVLGYAPDRVDSPRDALKGVRADHPYALLRAGIVEEAAAWLRERAGALDYAGSLDENALLPTAVGAAKPTALVPATMAAGDVRGGGRFLFVAFRELKDFFPALLAENLVRSAPGVEARAVELTLADDDLNSLGLARRFRHGEFRSRVVAALAPRLEPGERVGFPAALGLHDAPEIWSELQDRLAAPVFEVATLPPSVPGMRLYETLTTRLRAVGGRIVVGGPVEGFESQSGRVDAVHVHAAARPIRYRGRSFVIASGGFSGRGLELDSRGRVQETVLGLPVAGVPEAGRPRFGPDVFGEQPLARAGVAVDAELRPLDADGRCVFSNVRAAGAVIAGAEPWREASGNGIALATGYAAASAILAEGS